MDYRKLLKKYIRHVGIEEGVTFINSAYLHPEDTNFSIEEIEELKILDAESNCDCECSN